MPLRSYCHSAQTQPSSVSYDGATFLLCRLAPCWAWTSGGATEIGKGWRKKEQALSCVYSSCATPAMPLHLRQFIPVVATESTWRFFQHLENQLLPLGTLAPAGALSSEIPLVLAHVPPLSSEMSAQWTGASSEVWTPALSPLSRI